MKPTNRRRSTLRMSRPIDAFVAFAVSAFALGLAMPWLSAHWPASIASLAGRFGGMSRAEEVVAARIGAARDKALEHVVLQLDREPGFEEPEWPDYSVPWGHVPELTLFDDGTVVYFEDYPYGMSPPVPITAALAPEEAQRIVDAVVALGFDRLSSQESTFGEAADGTIHSVSDAGTINLRLRRDGVMTALRIYEVADFTSDPEAFRAIVDYLTEYTRPGARTLAPTASMLYRDNGYANISWVLPTALEAMFDQPLTSFEPYPGESAESDGTEVLHDASDWPSNIPLPEQFPAFVRSDAIAQLRNQVTAYDNFDLASDDPSLLLVPASILSEGSDMADLTMAVALSSSYWGWTFRLPEVDGVADEARIVAVPWIYGDRYPDIARDIDAINVAMAAVAAESARAEATAVALQAIATEEAANGPAPKPVVAAENGDGELPISFPFPPEARPDPLPFGLGIQTWQHWMAQPGPLDPLLDESAVRLAWLKQRYAWADLEPFGPTDFADNGQRMFPDAWLASATADRPLRPRVLIQLDVPPAWALRRDAQAGDSPFDLVAWERFVHQFARRYAGLVDAYEIMNEPNLEREWGAQPDPEAYAKVLAIAFRAIKMADPNAVVVSAGLAPTSTQLPEAMGDDDFLLRLYAAMAGAGGSDRHFDALGAHAPGFAAEPSIAPEEAAADPALGGQRYFTFRRVEDLRRIMVEHGDEAKQVVVTEFGWTTDARPDSPYAWFAGTDEQRAERLRAARDFARDNWSDWVGPLIMFTAADPAWTPDHEAWWWSVTGPGGGLRQEIREAFQVSPGF